jgi:TolA-binding protein
MWASSERSWRSRPLSLLVVAALLAGTAGSAGAQDTGADARLRKVESEIRALQRKVFPGGDERFFKPEVTSGASETAAAPAPSSSAVTDIIARMDALEAQLARLTGQVEESANRIAVLEQRAGIVRAGAAPAASSPPGEAPSGITAAPAAAVAAPAAATQAAPATATPPAAAAPRPAAPAAAAPPPSRVAAVRAIEKPQTNDPGDDEYSYGFRLWEAKFYPEARQQLKLYLDKYPRHARVSFGRNLLGRAFLDDGQPAEAAKWFLENYQNDKRGARAPDSLLFLAASMKGLKDDKRACIALAEFAETYATEAAGRLKGQYDETRRGLSCPS